MKLKYKLTGAIAALALVTGAVPIAVSSASAIPQKQRLIHKKWWPNPGAYMLAVGVGIAAIVLLTGGDDKPASP